MSLLSDRVTLSTHFKELQVVKNPLAVINDAEPVTLNIELKVTIYSIDCMTLSTVDTSKGKVLNDI